METIISGKIKKYLFFISIVFLAITFSHLCYVYVYNDAEITPVKWGNISEGILGTTINLNPLLNLNDENETILRLTHRSLLKFNPENGNFIKDLASCDIKNLKNIECYIESGNIWSDGSAITIDDIYKTYTRLKEVESDATIYPFLQDLEITKNENKIVFTSENSDINQIKMLLQFIVPGETIESKTSEEITWVITNPLEFLYSGPYIVNEITNDETTGIRSVVLTRNKLSSDPDYHIDKLSFRFFKEPNDLIKYKSLINVFNDTENILWEYSPRITTYEYKLPKITSVFINSDNISDKNLRGLLLEKIDRTNITSALWESFSEAKNPFSTDLDTTVEIENKDLDTMVSQYEYYSKSTIVDFLLTDEQKELIAEEEASKYRENPTLEYNVWAFENKFNFIEKDNILIEWVVDPWTVAVYIWDYKLTEFNEWDVNFFYRLEENSNNTIKQWINNYEIFFENADWEKVSKTDFIVAYNSDPEILTSYKDQLLAVNPNQIISGEVTPNGLSDEVIELKGKLDNLDDNFYYNRDLQKFSLSLAYITGNPNIEKTATIIQNTLATIWIIIELKPLSSGILAKELSEWQNNYDMILVWLNLGYFNYDLFPYFHSSQVKTWYNLSNFQKSSLDESLELLRERTLSTEDQNIQKEKIIKLLQEEQIVKSIYQPNERLLIDRNIKNFRFWEYLPNFNERINYIKWIYTIEEKSPQFGQKSAWWFISFLFSQLF